MNILIKKKIIILIKVSSKSKILKDQTYIFILDAMPLNEFKNFYKKNLENFLAHDQKLYLQDTPFLSITQNILTSFFLDKIFVESDNYDNNNLKPNIYKKFPALLSERYNPVLISELNKLGYEFKWVGNSFAACSRYNYRYCLSDRKEEYIDLYLLQSFLEKTPLIQIFNKITEQKIIQKNLILHYLLVADILN